MHIIAAKEPLATLRVCGGRPPRPDQDDDHGALIDGAFDLHPPSPGVHGVDVEKDLAISDRACEVIAKGDRPGPGIFPAITD